MWKQVRKPERASINYSSVIHYVCERDCFPIWEMFIRTFAHLKYSRGHEPQGRWVMMAIYVLQWNLHVNTEQYRETDCVNGGFSARWTLHFWNRSTASEMKLLLPPGVLRMKRPKRNLLKRFSQCEIVYRSKPSEKQRCVLIIFALPTKEEEKEERQ